MVYQSAQQGQHGFSLDLHHPEEFFAHFPHRTRPKNPVLRSGKRPFFNMFHALGSSKGRLNED